MRRRCRPIRWPATTSTSPSSHRRPISPPAIHSCRPAPCRRTSRSIIISMCSSASFNVSVYYINAAFAHESANKPCVGVLASRCLRRGAGGRTGSVVAAVPFVPADDHHAPGLRDDHQDAHHGCVTVLFYVRKPNANVVDVGVH